MLNLGLLFRNKANLEDTNLVNIYGLTLFVLNPVNVSIKTFRVNVTIPI